MISSKLRAEVLSNLVPTKQEDIMFKNAVSKLISIFEEQNEDLDLNIDFYVGGSFGKGTYLKNSFDVDIFCRCKNITKGENLSKRVEKLLTQSDISYKREKGSRDYFSGFFVQDNISIKFELVPTKYINSIKDAENSTDYSYLHVEFIKEQSKVNPKLQDEIRLTKALLKSKGWYGAESYIEGFSGHVIDLLIVHYGSLNSLIEEARNWEFGEIIDVAKHFTSKKSALNSIDSSKHSSLIVVDSILPQRNASKALGSKIFGEFLVWAQTTESLLLSDFNYVEKSLDDFYVNHEKFAKKNNLTFLCYNLSLGEVESIDIAGAKIKKLFEKIENYFKSFDFEIFSSDFRISKDFKSASYFYHISYANLPKKKWVRGPPVTMESALKKVISNHKSYEIKGKYLYYLVERDVINIKDIENITLNFAKKRMNSSIDFIISIEKK